MPLRPSDRIILPPLSPAELQEKLRSGEIKIESAPQKEVKRYEKELRAILELIAPFMVNEAEGQREWAGSCYITDQSQVGDFFTSYGVDSPKNLKALSDKLGFSVKRSMYLVDVAAKMRGVQ